jgi:hypothetical protein
MTYLGLSGAKQISRELTAGEIHDVVSNAKENIPMLPERSPASAKTKLRQHIDHVPMIPLLSAHVGESE